jgi:integrase
MARAQGKTGYSAKGGTEAEADADLARKLKSDPSQPFTLLKFAESAWFPTLRHRSKNTQKRYKDLFELHIREALGHKPIAAVTFADCQNWVNAFPGAAHTAHLAHCVLTQILRLAADTGAIPRNPAFRVSLPPKPEKRERVLTVAQAQVILEQCPPPLNCGVFLSMLLGLRLGEVCAVRWDDLERPKGELRIWQQAQQKNEKGGGIEMVPLKTRGSKRTLILPPDLIAEIDSRGDLDCEWVAARNGKQYPPETMSEHWRNWVRAEAQKGLKLSDWHFHDLRHSAAGLLYAAGVGIEAIAAVLGHTSIDMTWLYLSLKSEQRRDALQQLTTALKLGSVS